MNVLDALTERGFIENTTHERELSEYLENESVTCYIGFDPTASSLHVGHLIPIMSLAHMQRCGHRPIALVGGGTGMVGDPSGKTEMRQLLTPEMVNENAKGIKTQLSRFIDFNDRRALLENNADWLTRLEYIPFLRDIGRCFSVNRMIKAESYRSRLDTEDGLNFIEFNYMILQAYDFLVLRDKYGCRLQMGGSDQWGNIVAGIDLIRKMRQDSAFGITFPLITTSSGAKMGKTASGAVWLDPSRTSPYEYYQFWVNTDDRDVPRFLALFTFLPMDEIRAVENFSGADLNMVKSILAFETTILAHGESESAKAYDAASAIFGRREVPVDLLPSSSIHKVVSEGQNHSSAPSSELGAELLSNGIPAFKLFQMADLASSSGVARRLVEQGGAYVNGVRIEKFDQMIGLGHVENDQVVLRAGKKRFHIIRIVR